MAGRNRADLYGLSKDFEEAVAVLASRDGRFYAVVAHAIEVDCLASTEVKLVMKAVHAIAADSGRGPETSLVVVQRLHRWKRDGQHSLDEVQACGEMMERAEERGLPSVDEAVQELVPILKRRMEQEAIKSALDDYGKRGDLGHAQELLDKSRKLGVSGENAGVVIGDQSFGAIERVRQMERLPTGVEDLDFALEDGLGRGQLGIFMGGAGDGKSMALSHQTAYAVLQGYNCMYATLELPEPIVLARIKAGLTGIPINRILDGQTKEAKKRLKKLWPTMGRCEVKEFTAHATTVDDIRRWVRDSERASGKACDLLVIDYADKLQAPRENNEYLAMRVVYEGLRIFGVEKKIWVWTASQAGRGKGKKGQKMDLEDVSDSMHKVRVADLVITLNATEDEIGGREMSYFVAKNRTGKSRMSVGPSPTDFTHGRIAEVTW